MKPSRLAWQWLMRFLKHRVLHVEDSPHRIALGVALGLAVAWTPAIGLQTVILILLGWLVRANIMAGMPFLWLSNPLTVVAVYAPSYHLGCRLVGADAGGGNFVGDVSGAMGLSGGFVEKVQAWWRVTAPYAGPLWVGSMIMAVLIGALAYVATYWAVVAYRRRHPYLKLPLPGQDDSGR